MCIFYSYLTISLPKVINMKLPPIIFISLQQTGNEYIQTNQVEVVNLIYHKILRT